MASFFGIQTWFHKPVTELSGGQKQLLALASIMALQPSALILDEPTSQLDPIAAGEFLAIIGKINRELGVTIILTEHRLEEAFPLSSRAVVLDRGGIIADGAPREVGLLLRGQEHGMFLAMPTPMRVWAGVEFGIRNSEFGTGNRQDEECPITVRDGANWLNQFTIHISQFTIEEKLSPSSCSLSPAITLDDVWFKYQKDAPDVIKGLSFKANYGEITAILGGNGTGKTTTLSLVAGLYTPHRGKAMIHKYQQKAQPDDPSIPHSAFRIPNSNVCTLPQNPQSLFVAKTVREDLLEVLSESKLAKDEKSHRLAAMVKLCRLDGLLDFHPYDLSGGEQQRAALAKVLLLQPRILLLDEPTKGLDAEFKQVFAAILERLTDAGVAVIIASHDVEFCAEHADRCALFFDGSVVTENNPRAFFSGNSFYTTSANRMARAVLPDAITAGDIILALGGELPPAPEVLDLDAKYEIAPEDLPPPPPKAPKLSKGRKLIAGIFSVLLLAAIVFTVINFDGFRSFISGGSAAVSTATEGSWLYVGIMLALAIGMVGIMLALHTGVREQGPGFRRKEFRSASPGRLSKRTVVAAALILLAIPLTIYVGSYFFGDRKYYFVSLLIILQTMLPFALVFENRKPQARELVIIAVLCAIAVAGRAAFFMLPQFKPVIALVIIAGIAFGGEAGFLVGAMTGFVSNAFFGQGPWTPYQMFAFGVIGLLAGVLFRKGLLQRTPLSLAIFGAIVTFVIYGGIMNPSYVMIYQSAPTWEMLLAAYLQGIPLDLVHAAATVTFMLIISKPMLQKLDRIKVKYGLIE